MNTLQKTYVRKKNERTEGFCKSGAEMLNLSVENSMNLVAELNIYASISPSLQNSHATDTALLKMNFDIILQNVAKHIQLDKTETDFFVSLLQHKTLKRKDYLLKQGNICNNENFIIKGCLRTYTIDENGFEHIVMFGIEEWWVGDLYSFLTQTPADYFIDALEDSEVLQITRENLDKLYERVPKFEKFFRLVLQNAFIAQQIRINQNLSFTAEQRYLEFIKKYPQIEQRISQKQVSAFLGITPVFLSMIRRKLAHK